MVDSTQDISVREQTSIVVRYVDEFRPVKRLLDVVETPDTSSQALLDKIIGVFRMLKFELMDLIAYAFHGASNMDGSAAGLQALLKVLIPNSVHLYCYAHALQLGLEKCCCCVPGAISFFGLSGESRVYTRIPQKNGLVVKHQVRFSDKTVEIFREAVRNSLVG